MSTGRVTVDPDSLLSEVLPEEAGKRLASALADTDFGADITTCEQLYELIASVGGNWYKQFQGIGRDDAFAIVSWFAEHAGEIGEIPSHFYPAGMAPGAAGTDLAVVSADTCNSSAMARIFEDDESLGDELSGKFGLNRNFEHNSLNAQNDLQAISRWLQAKATNVNTESQYRKEGERFLLWCILERGLALSSITADDASMYPRWLEELGRTNPEEWSRKWRVSQSTWIGPKNVTRMSPGWTPFNGPLNITSRKTAMTVVRLLFNFLAKTGYLRFNPFDQVSAKVRYLAGEGAPRQFADRSLTQRQWEEVTEYLEGLEDNEAKARIRVILCLGKNLGMRASEMINAKAGWIVERRIGDEDMIVIEIVGKGDKVRRLPVAPHILEAINNYFALRHLPSIGVAGLDTPLIDNLGRGRKGGKPGISRSGLYRALTGFFEGAATLAEERSAADAAKLRAGSTHWLRHTFATTALKSMSINVVQNAMGHASIGTTSRYLTPEEAEIANAMKEMNSL